MPCAQAVRATVHGFNAGFDLNHSQQTGIISGVAPEGPAYAAGLRDGARILHLSIYKNDPEHAVALRVATDAGEANISYLPHGREAQAWQYQRTGDSLCHQP